jgi:ferredoxin
VASSRCKISDFTYQQPCLTELKSTGGARTQIAKCQKNRATKSLRWTNSTITEIQSTEILQPSTLSMATSQCQKCAYCRACPTGNGVLKLRRLEVSCGAQFFQLLLAFTKRHRGLFLVIELKCSHVMVIERKCSQCWSQLCRLHVAMHRRRLLLPSSKARRKPRMRGKQVSCLACGDTGVGEGAQAGLLEHVGGGALGGVACQQVQHARFEDAQRPQQSSSRLRVLPWRHVIPHNHLDRLQAHTLACFWQRCHRQQHTHCALSQRPHQVPCTKQAQKTAGGRTAANSLM